MNPETFFDKFGLLADTPNGVQKLRELILQLAVQGKLVRQNENDEPAAVLLGKIKAEKDRLIKEKKIRKPKPLSSNDVENPYELPASWKWTRLFDIGVINPRNKESDDIDASFVPMTLISETYSTPVSSERRLWGEIKTGFTHFAEEDVVLAKITPCFQNGKSAVMRGLLNGFGAGTTELHVFRPLLNESVNPDYVLLYLKSPQFLTEGIENMTGTAGQKRVPRDYFAGNPFPLPPFKEQRRIVAKVDQLMALCDELEARQQKKQETRLRLNSAALDKLLTAHEPAEFTNHWQRVCENFDLLYDNHETVGELRKAILQLAVQGKLVRQDENDEPAAVLLEKIRVGKGKNAKKLKPLPPVREDEIYFELPIGWQWVRFDDICPYVQRGKGPKYVEKSDIPVISQKCIQWDGFKLDRARFISPSTLEKYNEERFLCTGDLLWNSTGTGTIGRVNTYVHEDNSYDKVVADSHVTVVRPILLNSRFIYCWIASPIIQNEIEEMASGTTNQIELNLSTIKNHLVPIPPLQEQRRIVAKVDQLMALCDELESKLKQSKTDGAELMESVVAELVGA